MFERKPVFSLPIKGGGQGGGEKMNDNAKSNDAVILTIDAGTQSIRAAVVDLTGSILKIVKTPIEPYFSKHPGWAEQEPEYYWKMFCETCRSLLAQSEDLKAKIAAVSVTTQRATVVNVDKNGNPLRPAITWLDYRKADASKIIPGALRPVLKAAGLNNFHRRRYRQLRDQLDPPEPAGHLGKNPQISAPVRIF